MIQNTGSRILVGAMNLLAVGAPMLAPQVSHATISDQKIEQLNIASLKSIESTWLKVPMICKARNFNASAVPLETKAVSSHIQNIYSSFGVQLG